MTTKADKRPPYDYRSESSAGKYHGMGISSPIGMKKGTFTEIFNFKQKAKKTKPPRKMN